MYTRIVVFASLIVWVDFVVDKLIHLSVVLLQVDITSIQFVIQTFLLVTPAVLQDVCILLVLLVHSHLSKEVTNKEHSVSLQTMLGNHVEIEVSNLLIIFLAVKSIQHVSHGLVKRLHHIALKHLG